MFDPKIERTTRRNNSKNIKKKLQDKLHDIEEPYVSNQETMTNMNKNNNNDNNANNGKNAGGMPCHNTSRCLEHIARPQRDILQT